MQEKQILQDRVIAHPHPLLFVTISGAHLYGFPSPDSDFDLRGVHILPLQDVVGLADVSETIDETGFYDGVEVDIVTHDVQKFFKLMLKKNGYVLEQLLSPLVVHTTEAHEELKSIAADCVTKHHAHHYLGFAATQWKLFQKAPEPLVKPLLYVFRVLLTGIHLVRSGEVEANLVQLNEVAQLSYLDDLIQQKKSGPEKGTLDQANLEFYSTEYKRLVGELENAFQDSQLPEAPKARDALNDLLVRLRLQELSQAM